jgi:Arc/MetJ-type ribon-helix-helix transcriptional regulator
MRIITVNLPESYIRAIKSLVGKNGIYPSRSELIRVATREFLISELKAAKSFEKFQDELNKFPQKIEEIKEPPEEPKEEFEVDIDEILGLYSQIEEKKEEPMASEIEYKTEFQKNFQRIPTMIPPISERSGKVVDLGKQISIDGKVFNVK